MVHDITSHFLHTVTNVSTLYSLYLKYILTNNNVITRTKTLAYFWNMSLINCQHTASSIEMKLLNLLMYLLNSMKLVKCHITPL